MKKTDAMDIGVACWQKPRVREASSDRVIGVKSDVLFAKHGVKGAALPCGEWGGTPLRQPNARVLDRQA